MWEPSLSGLESEFSEILEICEEVKLEDSIEVIGPQIDLILENPNELEKPPVRGEILCGGSFLCGEEDGRSG